MKNKNIAVMIAGPIRYIDLVIDRLNKINNSLYEIDYYCFIWKSDTGNKKRLNEEQELRNDVHFLVESTPYIDKDFYKYFKKDVEQGQSNISSIIGMFYSMHVLVNAILSSPKEYHSIVRLRTDCLIIDNNFFDYIHNKNDIIVSKNYYIPHNWVSDHIMSGSIESMYKIWNISNKNKFYKEYQKIGMNPEKYLAFKINSINLDIIEKWLRYRDYHIVYNPAKDTDPQWIKDILYTSNNYEMTNLFNNIEILVDNKAKKSIYKENMRLKVNIDNYAKPLVVRVLKKLINIGRSTIYEK
jgi:hypothetical protein